MSTEASAVVTGGYAYLDKDGYFKVVDAKNTAEEAAAGKVIKFNGQHAYGHAVVPVGSEYEQLVIKTTGGNLADKFGRVVPEHVKAAIAVLV
ncbi:hypothetical protein [Paenibacillus sp. FSL K6-1230]|uniref:hypothetical protein n=1 Tax=Paenibacillus sp. FSL K6-1230 TaxID=2921603 RepID=UPI0030FCFEA6